MKKRIIAVLLAFLLLLSCFGCSSVWKAVLRQSVARVPGKAAKEQKYSFWTNAVEHGEITSEFQSIDHSRLYFSEMKAEHYDRTEFDALLASMTELAENGGNPMAFVRRNLMAIREIAKISTLAELMRIQSARNVYDTTAADETLYAEQTEIDMRTAYWQTLEQATDSPLGYLIPQKKTEEDESEKSSSLTDTSERLTELFALESEKEQRYYSLLAQEDYEGILSLFTELVAIRQEIASLCGYDHYADYAYEEIYGRDYSTKNVRQIWTAAKEIFSPLSQIYVESLNDRERYPWPRALDSSTEMILQKVNDCLPRIFQEAYDAILYMEKYHLYDIGRSDSKRNTGFTTVLVQYNAPFLFNAARGDYTDYTDVFHEIGHYVNYYYSESDLLYGSGGIDLAELQSQGMEIMFLPFYNEIFGADYGDTMQRVTIEAILCAIVDGALYDEFQYRVYAKEGIDEDGIQEIFTELFAEYGCEEYNGFEMQWMGVEHTVNYPFYYISYTVSAISALELLQIAESGSWEEATELYRRISALNVERVDFSEALSLVGLQSIFDEEAVKKIAESVAAFIQ